MADAEQPESLTMRRRALRFVLLIGVLSLFADFTYEGARSIIGPYLGLLGASATIVGIVTGFGEFLGYALRLVSGRWADASRRYWPITIFGYVVQMAAVPLLALTGYWPAAALLVILERVGKAVRNPPRDVMLSHAGEQMGGMGWAFGLNEALDQFGAMIGPLVVAGVLALRHDFRLAFGVLALPALLTLVFLTVARLAYPTPEEFESPGQPQATSARLPTLYWIYLSGAALAAAGFADYPLIAYHFSKSGTVPAASIAIFYSVAMAVSGSGSLLFGRMFDRHGFKVLVGVTVIAAAFAPLVFFGGFWVALAGAALWGLGMGVHESIIPAAVAPMVASDRRATAYGLFTAGYGIAWFIGSAIIGFLYDRSVAATVVFCVAAELAAVPLFLLVASRVRRKGAAAAGR
jgi:predicted MFS family arabinose efflux permease